MPQGFGMKKSLIILSLSALLLTGCATLLNGGPSLLVEKLTGQYSSEDLTPAEKEKLAELLQTQIPDFPPPTEEALNAIQTVNDPALNQWVVELTVLCRQLEPDC